MATRKKTRFIVNAQVAAWDIAKAGAAATFTIKGENVRQIGILKVGQGSLQWQEHGNERPRRISWNKLSVQLAK